MTTLNATTATSLLPIEARLRAMFEAQLVCVIRVKNTGHALNSARAAWRAGFKLVEVTLTVPDALDAIKTLAAEAPADVLIGAGTVMSGADARQCIDNGAQFIVSPICELDLIRPCRDAGVVSIPAGMTPTEIVQAWRMGAHVVKIFPAGSVGGPAFVRAVRGPLPDIPLWVSGMLSAREARDYLAAGVQLVGLGAAELLPPALLEAADWDALTVHAARVLATARGHSLA
jgi:2-dehydro-3-deoxyphosphogluconate aldolase/(4S)-4-hydroxy-2-oxoglutarate aldolase